MLLQDYEALASAAFRVSERMLYESGAFPVEKVGDFLPIEVVRCRLDACLSTIQGDGESIVLVSDSLPDRWARFYIACGVGRAVCHHGALTGLPLIGDRQDPKLLEKQMGTFAGSLLAPYAEIESVTATFGENGAPPVASPWLVSSLRHHLRIPGRLARLRFQGYCSSVARVRGADVPRGWAPEIRQRFLRLVS